MSLENKTNFILAVQGYKSIKKEAVPGYTDFTATDSLDKKVLLRVITPIGNEYICLFAIQKIIEDIKRKNFDQAIVISKKFTANAIQEMNNQKIQYVSDEYMPPFDIEDLYIAIVNCASNQCQKRCGKQLKVITECKKETHATVCKVRTLAQNAKVNFENGAIGLLKNDLKIALSLNQNSAR